MRSEFSVDDLLAQATCALVVNRKAIGTAWLFGETGLLLTAGHLVALAQDPCSLAIRFVNDITETHVEVVEWQFDQSGSIDFAILQASGAFSGRIPLPISLEEAPKGTFRSCGYGVTLRDRSPGMGTFVGPYDPGFESNNRLFRLRSPEMGEIGYSGAPIFCDELGAVVGIQIEAAKKSSGPGRDTILAMPLYRIGEKWARLRTIAQKTNWLPFKHQLVTYLKYLESELGVVNFRANTSADGNMLVLDIEQIYVPLKCAVEISGSELSSITSSQQTDTDSISRVGDHRVAQTVIPASEIIDQFRRIVFLGAPGTGKTTLLSIWGLTFAKRLFEAIANPTTDDQIDYAVPLFVQLRDFAKFYSGTKVGNPVPITGRLLLQYCVERYSEISGGARFGELISSFVAAGTVVFLLDGLDEIATFEDRVLVAELIDDLARQFPKNKYLITSRTVGYEGAARLSEGFRIARLQPFHESDVEEYIFRWFQETDHVKFARSRTEDEEHSSVYLHHAKAFVAQLKRNLDIWTLSTNPLLLTVIAAIYLYRPTIPTNRADLYEECMELLLEGWETSKTGSSAKSLISYAGPLGEISAKEKRSILEPVALWLHEHRRRNAAEVELENVVAQQFEILGIEKLNVRRFSRDFLRIIQLRTGIIDEIEPALYSFSHHSFQEYLAACAIVSRSDCIDYLLGRLEDRWWREVILFVAGHLSSVNRRSASSLVREILACYSSPDSFQSILIAAECLLNMRRFRTEGTVWKDVTDTLLTSLTSSQLSLVDRLMAGKVLGRLGDPRNLDEMLLIPSGKFLMGSSTEDIESAIHETRGIFKDARLVNIFSGLFYSEFPKHEVSLPAYRIAKYPVTHSAYKLFVDATGYQPPLVLEQEWATPYNWDAGNFPDSRANHPVTLIKWEDANTYCEWLSAETGRTIRLPKESEWEKAARGSDGSRFPWGQDWPKSMCNSYESGLGETSTVGMFSGHDSPFGLSDTIGNVWEWTSDWFAPYDGNIVEHELYGRNYRVAKGGSWFTYRNYARCASRYPFNPLVDYRGVSPIGFRIVEEI